MLDAYVGEYRVAPGLLVVVATEGGGENDFVLVVAWLLGALRAGGPYIAESG